MEKSMTLFGCGPKMAILSLPYLILSLAIMFVYPDFLDLKFLDAAVFKIAGYALLGTGLLFWIWSAVVFIRFFRPGELITKGPFALCRNPIYSSIIVFIIPSLALILHSGLILSIAIELFIVFKLSIHGETAVLRRIFGERWEEYKKSVNEIFPFPGNLLRPRNGNR